MGFAEMDEVEIWYSKIDATEFAAAFTDRGGAKQAKAARREIKRARRKDSATRSRSSERGFGESRESWPIRRFSCRWRISFLARRRSGSRAGYRV
jgi:hypothetical protein